LIKNFLGKTKDLVFSQGTRVGWIASAG